MLRDRFPFVFCRREWSLFPPPNLTGAATPHTLSHTLSMGSEAKKTELLSETLETQPALSQRL